MKYILIIASLLAFGVRGKSQNTPKVYDPCQAIDTAKMRQLIIGTWVDAKDTTHIMVITPDSVEETIRIVEGNNKKTDVSYWNYKFTDNEFSSDQVTCYSLYEFVGGLSLHTEYAINSIDEHYLLLGASGKMVFRRKN